MSIQSMTGFGRAAASVGGFAYAVEIRAVNHRYLDIRVRLPRELAAAEAAVRTRVGARLLRGRIEVGVYEVTGEVEGTARVALDLGLARAVREAHRTLADTLELLDTADAATIAAHPGVLVPAVPSLTEEQVERDLGEALERAIDGAVDMRRREGGALATELARLLDRIMGFQAQLSTRAPQLSAAYQARLERRVRDLLTEAGADADPGRILHEVALFAEKSDVAEELARLASHVAQARALLTDKEAKPEPCGRRLDFLCQEMAREANTVGSKVQDLEMSRVALDLKVELERLREQVQNVE
jgi:uncharacterized protein (TIGR00255 family)